MTRRIFPCWHCHRWFGRHSIYCDLWEDHHLLRFLGGSMTTDLVERLRKSDGMTVKRATDGQPFITGDLELFHEAADRIEKLEARLEALDIRPTPDGTGIIVGVIARDTSYHPTEGPLYNWLVAAREDQ